MQYSSLKNCRKYRNLACVGFKLLTNEFHSDVLTNWAIRQ